MILYIAGPMTGYPDLNYPAFNEAAEMLWQVGYEVLNPADNVPEGEKTWLAFMRMSLVQLSKADGIAQLPNWHESKGARLEYQIFRGLELPIYSLEHWLYVGLNLNKETPA
jgi:hypothetical protein